MPFTILLGPSEHGMYIFFAFDLLNIHIYLLQALNKWTTKSLEP